MTLKEQKFSHKHWEFTDVRKLGKQSWTFCTQENPEGRTRMKEILFETGSASREDGLNRNSWEFEKNQVSSWDYKFTQSC